MVAVTDEQMAAMRAYLGADPVETERLGKRLIEIGGDQGFGELVWATFVVAVQRHLAPEGSSAKVVQYVASIRARSGADPDDIEPLTAETLMRRALGETVRGKLDELTTARTQIFLLAEVVDDADLDAAGIDELLADARPLADQMLS